MKHNQSINTACTVCAMLSVTKKRHKYRLLLYAHRLLLYAHRQHELQQTVKKLSAGDQEQRAASYHNRHVVGL